MNHGNTDLSTMLDALNLPQAAECLTEILNSPESGDYSPQQLLRDVIEPQCMESMNRRYMTNLQLSRLINKNAQVEELVTSSAALQRGRGSAAVFLPIRRGSFECGCLRRHRCRKIPFHGCLLSGGLPYELPLRIY